MFITWLLKLNSVNKFENKTKFVRQADQSSTLGTSESDQNWKVLDKGGAGRAGCEMKWINWESAISHPLDCEHNAEVALPNRDGKNIESGDSSSFTATKFEANQLSATSEYSTELHHQPEAGTDLTWWPNRLRILIASLDNGNSLIFRQ